MAMSMGTGYIMVELVIEIMHKVIHYINLLH